MSVKRVLLTLNKRITMMHISPNNVSPSLKLHMSLDIDTIMSNRVVPAALIPIKSFICDATMSMATADVNPEFTGPEMKSIKKPAAISSGIVIKNRFQTYHTVR